MATVSLLVPSTVAILLLVVLSAFFSSSESAIFSLPDEWIAAAAAGGSQDALALRRLNEDPHRLLVTILVGNNLVNIAITSIVTLLVSEFVTPGVTVLLATLGTSVLILVFGEIVPKSYGLGHAQTWSLRVAQPMSIAGRLLGPLTVLFDASTEELTRLVGGNQGIERPYLDD